VKYLPNRLLWKEHIMTDTDVFTGAIAARKEQEARQAERDEAAARARREQEEARREQARITREHDRLKAVVSKVREGFFVAVLKQSDKWSSKTLELVQEYCVELTKEVRDRNNVPDVTTNLSSGLVKLIHDKFVYGMILHQSALPGECYVGQHQPWYTELLEEQQARIAGTRSDRIKISAPTVSIPDPNEKVPAPVTKALDGDDAEPRPAITPAKKRGKQVS